MSDPTLLHKEWFAWIGKTVCVSKKDIGTLKYFGKVRSKTGFWCGVELDEPVGMTDGTINNIQYFKCLVNHGILVPMHKVKRMKNRITASNHSLEKKSENEVAPERDIRNTTYEMDKHNCACTTKTESKNISLDKYVNLHKRSKHSSSNRLGTEESLGILYSLLEDDGSWDLLDHSTKKLVQNEDSVFSPPIKMLLPSTKTDNLQCIDNPLKKGFNAGCTSTPKPCLNTIFNLGETVKLDQFHFDLLSESFHDEIEPIITGSSNNKSLDLDLTPFNQNEILCSTSKLTIPALTTGYLISEETNGPKTNECDTGKVDNVLHYSRNGTSLRKNAFDHDHATNPGTNAEKLPETVDILNKTYEIKPEMFVGNASYTITDRNQNDSPLLENLHKLGNIDLNSTFVLEKSPKFQLNKTFYLDPPSPSEVKEFNLSNESDMNFDKKALSIILEKSSFENTSLVDANFVKHESLTSEENTKIAGASASGTAAKNSSSIHEKQGSADLNSTFSLSRRVDSIEKDMAYKNASKKYSLSSLSAQKFSVPKNSAVNLAFNSLKEPRLPSKNKATLQVPASYGASVPDKSSKNLRNSLPRKDVKGKKVDCLPVKTLKSPLKTNFINNDPIINVGDENKRKCFSLNKISHLTANASQKTTKVGEKNAQIYYKRQSIGNTSTKFIPKVTNDHTFFASVDLTKNFKNDVIDDKNGFPNDRNSMIKRRHTMVPTVFSNKIQATASLNKTKKDLPSDASISGKTQTKSNPKNNENIPFPKVRQDKFADIKENKRNSILSKPTSVERILKDTSKNIQHKLENKQNTKSTTPRKELLKPGTVSRLPVTVKSIKKPGFMSSAVRPQQNI